MHNLIFPYIPMAEVLYSTLEFLLRGVAYTVLAFLAAYALTAFLSFLLALAVLPFACRKGFGNSYFWMVVESADDWLWKFFVGLLAEIVAIVITPFVVLFANHETGRMPYGFAWMETWDALLPGYPLDQGFGNPGPETLSWYQWYRQAVCWLYRNRIYRFTTDFLGFVYTDESRTATLGTLTLNGVVQPTGWGVYLAIEGDTLGWEINIRLPIGSKKIWNYRAGYKHLWSWDGNGGNAQHCVRFRFENRE